MKKSYFIVILVATMIMSVSCVEKSAKYKALLASRDSLNTQLQMEQANYAEVMDILNTVENGFKTIRETESQMAVEVKSVEGKSLSQKEKLAADISQIKQLLDQNREKIAQLDQLSKRMGRDNASLKETIKKMEEELTQRSAEIASLQAELEKRNVKINELNTTVSGLKDDVSKLTTETTEQKATIKSQDEDLNTVWYVVATNSELKESQIITPGGLFKAKEVMNKAFNKSKFTQVDLRKLNTLPLNTKRAKILSSHPEDSYKLNIDAEKMITLEITNPEKFWSIQKYLVVSKAK